MVYLPGVVPPVQDVEALRRYVEEELRAIARALNEDAATQYFWAHKGGTPQNASHNVYTDVTFGTERFDIGGRYNHTTSLWTPRAGPVLMITSIFITAHLAATSLPTVAFRKNGVNRENNVAVNQTGVLAGFGVVHYADIDEANGTDTYGVALSAASDTAGNDIAIDPNEFHTHYSGITL